MTGETNLNRLLANMTATLTEDVFVFATLPGRDIPDGLSALMVYQEAEGTTLIVTRDQAVQYGVAYEFPCRRITLNVHSALEAVGFIARISTALSEAGMGVNPVAGFFHDHLFVPDGREQDAMTVLHEVSKAAAQR